GCSRRAADAPFQSPRRSSASTAMPTPRHTIRGSVWPPPPRPMDAKRWGSPRCPGALAERIRNSKALFRCLWERAPSWCWGTAKEVCMGMLKLDDVTHWSIPVNNLEEAEKFYQDVLGLEYKGRLGNSQMACFTV